jgi:hypothetical protein
VLSAVLATIFMPAVAVLAALCAVVFGISPHAIVTFGGTFGEPLGLLVWWAALLPPSLAYAVFCLHQS